MGVQIPLFPLNLLPLPEELVPLHIFEPRYRQLLEDMEENDIQFGIYCTHSMNEIKIGSVMKLESIIKKYPGGEADIVVRCIDAFVLDKMFRVHKTKLYPGGEVTPLNVDRSEMADAALYESFVELQKKRNIINHFSVFSLYQIAAELNLDLFDRYKILTLDLQKKMSFISGQVKFQIHLLTEEEKSRDVYHLN